MQVIMQGQSLLVNEGNIDILTGYGLRDTDTNISIAYFRESDQRKKLLQKCSHVINLSITGARHVDFMQICRLYQLRALTIEYSEIRCIPYSIAALTNLTALTLKSRQSIINNTLPSSISCLTNLTHLEYHGPYEENINCLHNLTTLKIGMTMTDFIPVRLSRLTSLTELDVGISCGELPDNFHSPVLKKLRIYDAISKKSVDIIFSMPALRTLTLASDELQSYKIINTVIECLSLCSAKQLKLDFSNATNLRELWLAGHTVDASDCTFMPNLQRLQLFSDTDIILPDASAPKLEYLHVGARTNVFGCGKFAGQAVGLKHLTYHANNIHDLSYICHLTSLTELIMAGNIKFPANFDKLVNLEKCWIGFTGPFHDIPYNLLFFEPLTGKLYPRSEYMTGRHMSEYMKMIRGVRSVSEASAGTLLDILPRDIQCIIDRYLCPMIGC